MRRHVARSHKECALDINVAMGSCRLRVTETEEAELEEMKRGAREVDPRRRAVMGWCCGCSVRSVLRLSRLDALLLSWSPQAARTLRNDVYETDAREEVDDMSDPLLSAASSSSSGNRMG